MTSVRRHLITGEPILYAPERAARPHAFGDAPAADERCPFCPGHESDTPPEIARIGEPWRVRVFPNKFPSVSDAEVIVETSRHEEAYAEIAHTQDIVRTYLERLRAHSGSAYTALFKNEGRGAGASLPHVHSQLMPLPFVPPRIARERDAFRGAAACPLCSAIESHRDEDLIIAETSTFVWLAPASSWMPFQQWILPKRHRHDVLTLDDAEISELAILLRSAAGATAPIGSFNWTFLTFPAEAAAHCYVDLTPRLTAVAGFEIGTGTFVEIIEPAAAAQRLRDIKV